MTVFEELTRRGLIAQMTHPEKIEELLNGEKVTFYIGFDATADSLHVGHFLQMVVMKIAEIRELSTKELLERVDAEVAAYDQKKINHSISPMDNPSQIKQQRRLIARMKTELRQRELNNK